MAADLAPGFAFDRAFPKLKSLIVERTGHFYYADKDDLLWERIRKRIRATGNQDCSAYLERLYDPFLGPTEWARLEAEITIGETFFFRYVEQFAALRDVILPELIERKATEKRLRIWSAGCSTGAETYSVAILVTQLLGEELKDWRVSIVGTDINENFLDIARRARFGRWALRSLTPEQKADYFLPATESDQWQLRPEFRSLVRFERHNLLSLLDRTSPLQFTEFDLILCRNVLIYFHPDMVNRIVEALRDTLVEAGWMLLGHAEPNPGFATMMQALNLPGTTAYRRLPGSPTWQPQGDVKPAWADVLAPVRPPSAIKPQKPAAPRLRQPPAPIPPPPATGGDAETLVTEVRRLADAGELARADAACKFGLRERPVDPVLHFYLGLVAQAMKRPSEAEKAFRDSIYLDKNFVMAHYHLGLHLIANGQSRRGQRSIANAARIAATLPPDCPLEEADGLTGKEFRSLTRAHLPAGSHNRGKS
ncbi:MAG: protein-glutamate methyltransferase [Microvirga sp.]|nr:protein-glutamate methyltransferase [Microvirga sp.]